MDSIDISWVDSYVKSSEGVTYLPEIMDKIKVKIKVKILLPEIELQKPIIGILKK